jgi:hypothetical protein
MVRLKLIFSILGAAMELNEVVTDIVDLSPPLKRLLLDGDAKIELELPISLLNIDISKNTKIIINIDRNKDNNYKEKYAVYMWGILYHKGDESIYISIGGLILKINKDLPFNIGDKLYIGLKIIS